MLCYVYHVLILADLIAHYLFRYIREVNGLSTCCTPMQLHFFKQIYFSFAQFLKWLFFRIDGRGALLLIWFKTLFRKCLLQLIWLVLSVAYHSFIKSVEL